MEDNLLLHNCSENDVVSLRRKLFKLEQLKFALKEIFAKSKLGEEFNKSLNIDLGTEVIVENGRSRSIVISKDRWFIDGINCEILRIGAKGWQKGKVKINIQFSLKICSEEIEVEKIESPLDDLRKIINSNK
jgi:hypothetical protein